MLTGLPRPLCSRVIPDVHNRQTDRQTLDRHTSDSIGGGYEAHRGGGIITRLTDSHLQSTKCTAVTSGQQPAALVGTW